MTSFRTEFPDYPESDMPQLPEGFEDTSWHNDACPSYSNADCTIWIDYVDPTKREHNATYPRFNVQPMRDGIEITGDGGLMTDSWDEVLSYIARQVQDKCQHRDSGRGVCIDCGKFLEPKEEKPMTEPTTYETALRNCLLDAAALLQSHLDGRLRFEQTGQVKAVIRDAQLLRNREDCPNYSYRKR
jgi:hypothetical protein